MRSKIVTVFVGAEKVEYFFCKSIFVKSYSLFATCPSLKMEENLFHIARLPEDFTGASDPLHCTSVANTLLISKAICGSPMTPKLGSSLIGPACHNSSTSHEQNDECASPIPISYLLSCCEIKWFMM